jgi:hypothetical protein
MITRPNGKPYRPRKVIAAAVCDEDESLAGVIVLGTHDLAVAQTLADRYAAWQLGSGTVAADPLLGWYRDGLVNGQRCWITDEARGRAGIWFRSIAECADPSLAAASEPVQS